MPNCLRWVLIGIAFGLLSEGLAAPQIVVRGRGVEISNGDTTPDAADGSDFGSQPVVSGNVTVAFLIYNEGATDLTTGPATITGLAAADYTIVGQPNGTVVPGTLTTLIIRYDPVASGLRTATVNIPNNDASANPFTFAIHGTATGTGHPEVGVSSVANVAIADGDSTPSAADGTDFGTTDTTAGQLFSTFRIENTGSGDLTLAAPTITGPGSPDFTIISQPALTIAPGNQTTMTIQFDPSVAGLRAALVAFQNNDSDESPYDFAIQGTGSIGTEIAVSGNGIDIVDGDATPSAQDGTYFGELSVVGGSIQRTFVIRNAGPENLTIATPTITGAAANDFSILGVPAATVAPGSATSLVISFDTTSVGQRNATVSFGNNDGNENPFDFAIQGVGLAAAAPEIAVHSAIAEIVDGDTTPSAAKRTDFGTAPVNFGYVTRTFTITNSGSATLNLAPPTISGADFALHTVPDLSLLPGESTRFQLRFIPTAAAARSATITILNNDANESNYDFTVHGVGAAGAQNPSFTTFLKASDSVAGRMFGLATDVSGNTAVVGSEDGAYVFVYDGTTWQEQTKLSPPNGESGDHFGTSVAISGNTIVVGARGEDSSSTGVNGDEINNAAVNAGAAYVFVRNGNTWLQQAFLKASNTDSDDFFGYEVAISGDTIVVGAVHEDSDLQTINGAPNNGGARVGAAYVFVRDGVTWSQQAFLKPSAAANFDLFGAVLDIDGDTIVAGAARQDPNNLTDAGRTFVFVRDGATWTQQAELTSPSPEGFGWFGTNVAVSGDTLVIAARAAGVGKAYVYNRLGSAWSLQSELIPNNAEAGDQIEGVAISGDRILLTSPHEDSGSAGWNSNPLDNSQAASGAAFLFERNNMTWTQRAYIKTPAPDFSDFLVAAAVDGDLILLGAPLESSASQGLGGDPFNNQAGSSGAAFAYDLGRIVNPPLHPQIGVFGAAPIPNQSTVIDVATGTDFGKADWTSETVDRTFTITNSGIGTLYLNATVIDDASGSFAIQSQPASVAPGATGSLALRYDPTSIGAHTATVSITNNDLDDEPFRFAVGGMGILPRGLVVVRNGIEIPHDPDQPTSTASGTDYGIVSTSGSLQQLFIISNSSITNISIEAPVLHGPGRQDYVLTGNSATLAPHTTAAFLLSFAPRTLGTRRAIVSFGNTDPFRNPYEWPVSGFGGPAPRLEVLNPSAAHFPSLDLRVEAITNVFTITNSGDAILTLSTPQLNGPGVRNFAIRTNPATVLPIGGTTTLAVSFDPQDIGLSHAVLSLPNNDPDRDPFLLPLSGTGTSAGPQMLVTGLGRLIPNRDASPNQGDGTHFHQLPMSSGSVERTFIIHNVGNSNLTVSPPTINGGVGDFTITSTPSSIVPPGGQTSFRVRYDASGQGVRSATVMIQNTDASDSTYFFPIEGRGLSTAPPEALEAYLKASVPGADDGLGRAIAISGNTAVVGAPAEDGAVTRSGAAHVYVRTGTAWTQQAILKASVPDTDDQFGASVSIDGDTIVIGAPREDGDASGNPAINSTADSGAAYVFVRSGGAWTQQAYLKAANAGAGDQFGGSVSVDGDTIAIGAQYEDNRAAGFNPQDGNSAPDAGAAYVFVRQTGAWSQQAYLKAFNPDVGDGFGSSVAVSGDLLVAGAPKEDGRARTVNGRISDDAADSGAVYAFVRSGTTWAQESYLKPGNNHTNMNFGLAVAIDGNRAVVGAPHERSADTEINGSGNRELADNIGAAFVFQRDNGVWTQEVYLKAFNARPDHRFGEAVAIFGSRVVVGAPWEDSRDNGAHSDGGDALAPRVSGAAYVFTANGVSWEQQYFLKAPNADANDEFGDAVALNGELVIVGAPGESSAAPGINGNSGDNSLLNSGAVYVYDPDSPMIPDIVVHGLNGEILDGTQSASLATGTDFGSIEVPAGEITRTFFITNAGTGNLTLQVPTITGQDFLLTSQPALVLTPGQITSFSVLFDPSASGLRTASVVINNNDPGENPFDFVLHGVGLAVSPEIEILGNGFLISHLDFQPSPGDGTHFGSTTIGAGHIVRRFAINNTGNANLPIHSVGINGAAAAEFTVIQQPSGRLGPGQSTEFSILFDPSVLGQRLANVTVFNGDSDEAAFTFAVQGEGLQDSTPLTALRNFLKASNTDEGDALGFSVAISGNTAVIGAQREASSSSIQQSDNAAPGAGAAYVYIRNGDNWTFQAYLKANDPDVNDNFGHSVAIDGDLIAVGAPNEDSSATTIDGNSADDSAPDAGAVYVFARNGEIWSPQAYLKPPNAEAGDRFGTSVSVSGSSVLVGAPQEDSNTTTVNGDRLNNLTADSGAAYLFTRFGSFWLYQTYLKPFKVHPDDRFGHSVSLSGDTMIVGAFGEDFGNQGVDHSANFAANGFALNSGAAYIFQRVSGAVWSQQAYLKASHTDGNDQYGWSVAVSGDTAIVGAFAEDSGAGGGNNNVVNGSGTAYVYVRSGATWSQQAQLKASHPEAGDSFGWSVAIDGNLAVVGAVGEDSATTVVDGNQADNTANDAGAGYVFRREGATWTPLAYLKASNTGSGDFLGRSAAISGTIAIVGADLEDSADIGPNGPGTGNTALQSGAAYTFDVGAIPGARPTILQQPASTVVYGSGTLLLSVSVTNALTFQWYYNGAAISGQTGATLSLTGVRRVDSGLYWVTVSGAGGSVTSTPAAVRVIGRQRLVLPVFQPDGRLRLRFSDDADNALPNDLSRLQLQWRENLPTAGDNTWNAITSGFNIINGQFQIDHVEAIGRSRLFYRVIEQ